jgi:hypothetical protein
MIDKFYNLIHKILLRDILQDYRKSKTVTEIKKNYKNFTLLEKQLQKGGKNLKIIYKKETYTFDELDDPFSTIKTYVLQAKDSDSDCIMITIDKITGISSINNLTSTGIKCSETLINNIGKYLVEITIKLLKKYKDKLNIKKIELSDHSFLYCNNTTISLADLYILKHGITFYSLFGFLPTDYELKKSFYNNNIIMKNLKIKDSKLLYFLNKYSIEYKKDINHIINYITKNQDKLLMNIINKLSSKDVFNNNCELLIYIIPKLIKVNGIKSFHNKTFELEL